MADKTFWLKSNKILVNDPDKRINIEDIKKHPFFIRGKNLFDEQFNISKY